MAYILSVLRGSDPMAPPASLGREEARTALRGIAGTRELTPETWRFENEGVSVQVTLPPEDPGRELRLQIGWSTADHLASCLEFALGLAQALKARVYDRNGGVYVERERIADLRRRGGFAPASKRPPWWRFWG